MAIYGELRCTHPLGTCQNPIPRLSFWSSVALFLFTKAQTCWQYAGSMSGIFKTGIDKSGLQRVAKAYGIPWTDWVLDRIIICESEILHCEAERAESARQSTKVNDV